MGVRELVDEARAAIRAAADVPACAACEARNEARVAGERTVCLHPVQP